jgi:O-antigen ligase
MPPSGQDHGWVKRFREAVLPVEPGRTVPVLLLCATIVAAPLSITFIELFLVLAVATAMALGPRLRLAPWPRFPVVLYPLLAFVFWSILSALVSRDPVLSLLNLKKLFLFALVPAILLLWDRPGQFTATLGMTFAAGGISAAFAIGQLFNHHGQAFRIHGLMGHHMTFSGQMMLLLGAMAILLTRDRLRRSWRVWPLAGMMALCGAALVLTLTRSSWLGLAAGCVVALTLLRPRWLLPVSVLALAIFLVSPEFVQDRFRHFFDTAEAGNAARIDMLHTGLRIVRDRPLFGVGPRMIEQSVYDYGANPKILPCFYQHLHNNVIQLAAERGIPALAFWIWFMLQVVWDHGRWFLRLRSSGRTEDLAYPALALTAVTSLCVAGLFEFNFGDSEVLALFLTLVAGAYLARDRSPEPAADAPA